MGTEPTRGEFSYASAGPDGPVDQPVGPYLRAVRKHWLLVIIVTLLTGAVAAVTVLRSGKTYDASASVLVTPIPQGDPSFDGIGTVIDSGDPARTVQTAAALITSNQAAAAAAKAVGSGYSESSVQSAVSVTPLGQSDVLSVTATARTPAVAAALADAYANAAVSERGSIVQANVASELTTLQSRIAQLRGSPGGSDEIQALSTTLGELSAARARGGDPTLSVSQLAQPPTGPSGTPGWLIVLLALVAGFALASVAALGLDFFSRPIRDDAELSQLFPVPVLARVPHVRQRGSAPLSPWMFPPAAFEQIRMLRVQLELGVQSPLIMVTSACVGDGKTTLAAGLAAAFSENGQDVIVIDLERRRPSLLTTLTGGPIEQPTPSDQPLGSLISFPHLPHVRMLPVSQAATADEIIEGVPRVLAEAQRTASFVIIDTAPVGEVSEALRIAPMCGGVVFVARTGHTDRRRLVVARDLLDRAAAHVIGIVSIGRSFGASYGGHQGYHTSANGVSKPSSGTAIATAQETAATSAPHEA